MADKKISMEQLDAAMQYTSHPLKKLLLANYADEIKAEDLNDDYGTYTASVTLSLDYKKNVRIYYDLVKSDYVFNMEGLDLGDKDKIANVMVFLRLCLDICTPLYCKRFDKTDQLKCDIDSMTYYINKHDAHRLAVIIDYD